MEISRRIKAAILLAVMIGLTFLMNWLEVTTIVQHRLTLLTNSKSDRLAVSRSNKVIQRPNPKRESTLTDATKHKSPETHPVFATNASNPKVNDKVFFTINNQAGSNADIWSEEMVDRVCHNVDIFKKTSLTSTAFSKIEQFWIEPNTGYTAVRLRAYSASGVPKMIGGDFITVAAKRLNDTARISGYVIDHKNGSYTGYVPQIWNGETEIRFRLGAVIENTCLRFHAIKKYGHSFYSLNKMPMTIGIFKRNNVTQSTPCSGEQYLYGHKEMCNFTSLNDGMTWYCGKPKTKGLTCDHIYLFKRDFMDTSFVAPKEKCTISSKIFGTIQNKIKIDFKGKMHLDVSHKVPCKKIPAISTWLDSSRRPTGFWRDKKWNFLSCSSNITHNKISYRSCLRGKTLYLLGDSTIRQYTDYFISQVLGSPRVDLKNAIGPNRTYQIHKFYANYGIKLMYLRHAMPFINPTGFPPNKITSFVTEIDNIAKSQLGGEEIIIVVNYNAHFPSYPLSVYRQRVSLLADAVHRLLTVKPGAKVLIKSPHFWIKHDMSKWYDNKMISMYIDIIEQAFHDLKDKVYYLDIWTITLAFDIDDLHPQGDAMRSQIQQLMTLLC